MLDRSDPRKESTPAKRPIDWKPVEPVAPVAPPKEADDYDALDRAGKRDSIFNRWNQAFHEVLTSSRGTGRVRSPAEEIEEEPSVAADDLAIRRAKNIKPQRMIVPEGVIISGSMSSGTETEISGRVEGDVTVEGRLYLGPSALVTGNVRAASCFVDGHVEGRVECTQDLEIGRSGRLNADALGGKEVIIGGQVLGDITTGGCARLRATTRLNGNIRARRIVIEEGALFNGTCSMRALPQRAETPGHAAQDER